MSDDLKQYLNRRDVYLHFSFRPDPQKVLTLQEPKNGGTPVGVFAYETKSWHTGKVRFASGRPYVFVLKADPGVRLFDILNTTEDDLLRGMTKLKSLLEPEVSAKLEKLFVTKKDQIPRTVHLLPGAKLYYMVMKAHTMEHRQQDGFSIGLEHTSPVDARFATQLLNQLGYDGIRDTVGMVYSSEPEQVCFFDPGKLHIVDMLSNPLYDGRKLDLVT
jgi:hypothetical protein